MTNKHTLRPSDMLPKAKPLLAERLLCLLWSQTPGGKDCAAVISHAVRFHFFAVRVCVGLYKAVLAG